jgi:hypothetical protein
MGDRLALPLIVPEYVETALQNQQLLLDTVDGLLYDVYLETEPSSSLDSPWLPEHLRSRIRAYLELRQLAEKQ